MNIIHNILQNQILTHYIIAIQIPIVICMAILSLQIFKLGHILEFKYIFTGWLIQLIYLFVFIFIKIIHLPDYATLFIRSTFDLFSMYFFLKSTIYVFNNKYLSYLKLLSNFSITCILLSCWIIKLIPGSTYIIPYIHLRYFPAAFVDFTSFFLLSFYFRKLSIKYSPTSKLSIYVYILFYSTLLYAIIQFLSIAQRDKIDPRSILYIDNLGFGIGLVLKICILICLTLLSINIVTKLAIDNNLKYTKEEKEKLLAKLKFATNLLNIESRIVSKSNITDQENFILKSVLDECLNLINEKLGFYASYDDRSREVKIIFSSTAYGNIKNYAYSVENGITSLAIKSKREIVINNTVNNINYSRFSNTTVNGEYNSADKNVKSAIAIPLLIDDKVIGIFMLESEKENFFNNSDIDILKSLVAQASMAIKNLKLAQQIQFNTLFLNSLRKMDNKLTFTNLELKNILRIILNQVLKIVNGQFGGIALKTGFNELTVLESTNPSQFRRKLAINDSISGKAILENKTIYIPDINNSSNDIKLLYKNYLGDNLLCELVVPLMIQNEVIGVFNIESNEVNKFTEDDIDKINDFAQQAAIAIHIFIMFDEISQHQVRMGSLASIDRAILDSNFSLNEVLNIILSKGLSLINNINGEILLLDNVYNPEFLIVNKSTHKFDEGIRVPFDSICGISVLKKSIVYLPSIDKEYIIPKNISDKDIYFPTNIERISYKAPVWGMKKSEIVVPLVVRGLVIGVLNIESDEYNDFQEDEINLLRNLALAAAMAIHNAQQFEEIKNKNAELENSISKRVAEMAILVRHGMVHEVGGWVGLIRTNLIDIVESKKTDEKILNKLQNLIGITDKVINSRYGMQNKLEKLLSSTPSYIDYVKLKETILNNEEFKSNNNIKITVDNFDNLPRIKADFETITDIVLFELIRNSIGAMPGGGNINIYGKLNSGFIDISVADNGIGIEEENINKIFLDKYTTRGNEKHKGNGLYVLKSLVELHYHGQVKVESKKNKGTIFTISFPIK